MKLTTINANSGTPPIFLPNSTMDGVGFYVSYNDYDHSIYGGDTTALVAGQMEKFYILNGDHRAQYLPLISKGLDACLTYFKVHIQNLNKYSDKMHVAATQ